MPRDRGFLWDCIDIGKARPQVATAAAGICAALALLSPWLLSPLWATLARYLLWPSCACLTLGAVLGFIDLGKRKRRFESQRTIRDLHEMTWREFEHLVADMYRRQGYRVRVGPGQQDGGVDLWLTRDSEEVLVQCKQYRTWRVGEPKVREFYGAMAAYGKPCRGHFVTCGDFTVEARQFAEGKPIDLVDGHRLLKQILDVNGVAPPATSPSCPDCGRPMVRRLAHNGPHAGFEFWGCPDFPRCRGLRPMVAKDGTEDDDWRSAA